MARETVDYHTQLRQAHPRFDDCPRPCAEAEKDLPDFCRECEVRIQWGYFEESFSDQVARRFGEEQLEWSFETLYADTVAVMNVDARLNGEGYPPDCSAILARCLEIVRREEHRPERIRLWELEQKLKSKE